MRWMVASIMTISTMCEGNEYVRHSRNSASGSSALAITCRIFAFSRRLRIGTDIVESASDAPDDMPSSESDGVGSRGPDGSNGVFVLAITVRERANCADR